MKDQSALILSGGGARAAYQVGVLSALGKMVPKRSQLPFSILCGTSAGALNATMLATNADNFTKAVSNLAFVWRHLTPDQVYSASRFPIASSITKTLLSLFHFHNHDNSIALMDNDPLRELLTRSLDFERIQSQINLGNLSALAVTAMGYNSGESTTFFQAKRGTREWKGNRRKGVMDNLTVDHLLASSAIPIVFPAVKIHQHYYGDGTIRQKSAIYPALQLGANKLFIIGVSGNRSPKKWSQSPSAKNERTSPSMAQILGQLLNSAFIDNLEDDIAQLEIMNSLINDLSEDKKSQHILPRETLVISPSEEINFIAEHYLYTLPKNIRVFLRATGGPEIQSISSAASYLLFTPEYCRALMELGYKDAMWEKEKIMDFLFSPDTKS